MWRQRISEIDIQADIVRDAIKRINRLATPLPAITEDRSG
jgi:hypothetical protein